VSSAPSSPAELARDLRGLLLEPAEAARIDVQGRIDSAVLVPLFLHEGALHAVFTRRGAHLRRHAGEISFPGGRRDAHDPDLVATALREAEEEIGLPADVVEVLGALAPTPTVVTNYRVYPFVGLIDPGRQWRPAAREVDAVLELGLAALRDGARRERLVRRGIPFRTDVYVVDDQLIWGATARIVADLLARLGPLAPGTTKGGPQAALRLPQG
jgi:8-oxo-dGTP pyrophosphatase MutT (NUDIX family)